jgi:hypothetical protein
MTILTYRYEVDRLNFQELDKFLLRAAIFNNDLEFCHSRFKVKGELFPRIGFVVTNSRLPAGKVINVYNGRGDVENRIKEVKNTLRWDKTSCQRFEANQARLKMGVLVYNLLHMIHQFYVWGEEVRRSIDWLIKRLIKVGARVSYHAQGWHVHVASAFPLAHHYRAVLAWGP